GALRFTRSEARLGKERGLLIDRQSRHGQVAAERGGLTDLLVAVDDLRQGRRVDLEQGTCLVGPARRLEIEQQASRGRRRIRDERSGEALRCPRVDHRDDAPTAPPAAKPGHLRSGEVRVERQARYRGESIRVSLELARDDGGAPVLPAQRGPERFPGVAVPPKNRFPLVAETDRLALN